MVPGIQRGRRKNQRFHGAAQERKTQVKMKQFLLTSSMGKRLIGKGLSADPRIQAVLERGTLVIIAGSTNGYVAEEILAATGQADGFSRVGFRRGMTAPPGFTGMAKAKLEGDVVLVDGVWRKGRTIFDEAGDLKAGDVILKGANAVDLVAGQAAVYIGDPQAGTIGASLPAVFGRRVQLIVPVGLEKRVVDDVNDLAAEINAPDVEGPRLLPMPGAIYTELEAINTLTGAMPRLLASGGTYGAEGSVYVGVRGTDDQVEAARKIIESIQSEPPCEV